MSIEIRGVEKRFGDFVALSGIDVSIPTGQLTALLGPSGGGKSTLLRIIAGLEDADAGTVEIEGVEATHLPPQKRNVGFVFQHYAAFKHLSVARNVAFGLEIRKRPKAQIREKVQELLELVHLEQFADRLFVRDDPRPRIASWPAEVQAAVAAGKVMTGMTKEQVVASIGHPRADRMRDAQGRNWVYRATRDDDDFDLDFDAEGRVVAVNASSRVKRLVVHDGGGR